VDRERAQRYWRTHHARLARRVATMPWYQQSHWTEAVARVDHAWINDRLDD
jgi:hypothetical protein